MAKDPRFDDFYDAAEDVAVLLQGMRMNRIVFDDATASRNELSAITAAAAFLAKYLEDQDMPDCRRLADRIHDALEERLKVTG